MKYATGENHYSVAPFDNSLADSSWTQDCARECGTSETCVIDVISYYQEHHERDSETPVNTKGQVVIEKMIRVLFAAKNPWLCIRLLAYALNSPALDDVMSHLCPSDIARMGGVTKQAANKALKEIQEELRLKPRIEQRATQARKKMSDSRKSQLTNQNHE